MLQCRFATLLLAPRRNAAGSIVSFEGEVLCCANIHKFDVLRYSLLFSKVFEKPRTASLEGFKERHLGELLESR